jgi:hypothetical protein
MPDCDKGDQKICDSIKSEFTNRETVGSLRTLLHGIWFSLYLLQLYRYASIHLYFPYL